MEVRESDNPSDSDWLEMRGQLWPNFDSSQHRAEMEQLTADTSRFVVFLALNPEQRAIGFAEVSLRSDYVNGCETSPVPSLKGST
jgi:aminoglycoside 6'-N-acetyltransferase I